MLYIGVVDDSFMDASLNRSILDILCQDMMSFKRLGTGLPTIDAQLQKLSSNVVRQSFVSGATYFWSGSQLQINRDSLDITLGVSVEGTDHHFPWCRKNSTLSTTLLPMDRLVHEECVDQRPLAFRLVEIQSHTLTRVKLTTPLLRQEPFRKL